MSSNDIAIKVENISKVYRIGLKENINENFCGAIFDFLRSPLKNYRKYRSLYMFDDIKPDHDENLDNNSSDIIYALKDVSFEVKRGEALGIIGRNGAGKSTLLKILSKITDPTRGYAEVHGRISSLLEVGTGFHPELTGRENIYLNGTILGMKRKEVDHKFDEIVDFSGVERFLDTPVKRYSSGMTVRLAFSVAAHLEPEILLVDEVLAVGDLAFQKKCLGKMDKVAKEGRTVLFVSHNMGAISNLCSSALWIDNGKKLIQGDADSIISSYIKSNASVVEARIHDRKQNGSKGARIADACLLDTDGHPCDTFRMGETIVIEFDIEFYHFFESVDFALNITRMDLGMNILHMINQDGGFVFEDISKGKRKFRVELPNCLLYPGSYKFSIWVGSQGGRIGLDSIEHVLDFSMVQSSVTMRTTPLAYSKESIFYMPSKWKDLTARGE